MLQHVFNVAFFFKKINLFNVVLTMQGGSC